MSESNNNETAPSVPPGIGSASPPCAFCLAPIAPDEGGETCPSCRAIYHRDCWCENGGCAVYGCANVPQVTARQAIEVPFSYWGKENKPCPACGQEILAAAVRCRHCGATFSSARPQDSHEFHARSVVESRLPAARRATLILFVLGVIPFTAPFGAVGAWIWGGAHRDEIELLPALHRALHRIGFITASICTGVIAVMTLLYFVFRAN